MGKIQQLNEHLTNMIAAGEVVERPMGVVKELVENSIDAKATSIEITIVEGGLNQITITDNGQGMDSSDAVMAFQRHATSKIKQTSDLWSIITMGFRGEALPSIASVSDVLLKTSDGKEATQVEVKYGKTTQVIPITCPKGTSITIKGLFLKTPARLKHMKTVAYETALVLSVVEKFALSHPFIAFSLITDNKTVFSTNGNGNLVEIMYQLYGKETAKHAIEVSFEDYDYKVKGVIVAPHVNRANRNHVILFINQRMIKSFRIQKIVLEAYRNYLADSRYPIVVLDIQMDSKLVDVNVHPSKWEIRLSKQNQLEHLIKTKIEEFLKQETKAVDVAIKKEIPTYEKIEVQNFDFTYEEKKIFKAEEEKIEYPVYKEEQKSFKIEETKEIIKDKPKLPNFEVIGQLHGKYILAQAEEGLYIIDQHAAQERYHYEMIQSKILKDAAEFMDLLVPVVVDASLQVISQINEVINMCNKIGLDIEQFSQNQVILRKIPVWMKDTDMTLFLKDIIDLWQDGNTITLEKLRKDSIASLACHSSIRFNRILSINEMEKVIYDLTQCEQPYHCPHGRPTFILMSEKQLLKEFNR